MGGIIMIAYVALSYWAIGKTLYANKIRVGTMSDLFLTRLFVGFLLGWVLIPVAILKSIFFKN